MSEFFTAEDWKQAVWELDALNNRWLESAHVGRYCTQTLSIFSG